MLEVLVNPLGGLSLPRKSVVRLTDRPDMTLDVYRGRKTTMQQQQQCKYSQTCLKGSLYLGVTCLKQPLFWGPLKQNTVQITCTEGSPVLSSQFLCVPWANPLRQVWLYRDGRAHANSVDPDQTAPKEKSDQGLHSFAFC